MEAGADDIQPVNDEDGNPTTSYKVRSRVVGDVRVGVLFASLLLQLLLRPCHLSPLPLPSLNKPPEDHAPPTPKHHLHTTYT